MKAYTLVELIQASGKINFEKLTSEQVKQAFTPFSGNVSEIVVISIFKEFGLFGLIEEFADTPYLRESIEKLIDDAIDP